jgi:4-diphosphocytidyl-2-C-methyl-D-erythritol kinase
VSGATEARVEAQAKINLRLRILAREETGYHQLETLFLRLTLADGVVVRPTRGDRSLDVAGDVDSAAIGPVAANLAWRAAEAYVAATGWPAGFAIELEKRIPIGGGLGGGSADAGAVLRALDTLNPIPIGETALMGIAQTLGADVPFLTCGHPYALGWGRGERLLALEPLPSREVALLLPAFGVNTAAAYGWVADARRLASGSQDATGALTAERLSTWESLAGLATNDFQPVVAARHPAIEALVRALLSAGCRPALMSGSGSSVFGVLPGHGAAARATLEAGLDTLGARMVLTRTADFVAPVTVA